MDRILEAFRDMGATVRTGEICEFVVGTQGLSTSIDQVYWEDQWQIADLPPNTNWEHVKVRNEAAMNSWIKAKNRYLLAAWTPNQDDEERAENAQIMRDAEKMMSALEIK